MTQPESAPAAPSDARPLADILFGEERDPSQAQLRLFAVIDGAQVSGLLGVLAELTPPNDCLFAGKLDPSVARVAPYLVELERGSSFADWLLDRHWAQNACIFLRGTVELDPLRKHLKGFTMAKLPDGQRAFFRFYDPRVLRVYLPSCNAEEVETLFGDAVEHYLVESESGEDVLEFAPGDVASPAVHAARR